jgi:hypothetical protein
MNRHQLVSFTFTGSPGNSRSFASG